MCLDFPFFSLKNPKFWWAFIAFLVVWSLWVVYPPTNQSLIQEFKKDADEAKEDAAFNRIFTNALALQQASPDPAREFTDLQSAIGTNDIQVYFPYNNVKGQEHPTYALLNILQKESRGQNPPGWISRAARNSGSAWAPTVLSATDTNHNAVYRRGGKKEPGGPGRRNPAQAAWTRWAWPNRSSPRRVTILIELPGLSQSAQDEARKNIQKVAYLEFRMVSPDSDKNLRSSLPSFRRATRS